MKKLLTGILLLLPTIASADALVAQSSQPSLTFRQVASSDHLTAVTGATIAAAECRYSINGAAAGNCTGTWAEVEQGGYKYIPSTTETGTVGFVTFYVKDSTADLAIREIQVGLPYNVVNPRGTLQSATATTAVLAAAENAADDRYNYTHKLVILSGTGAGQSRCITDYVNASDTAVVPTWGTTPDNTSTYDILPDAGCGISTTNGVVDTVTTVTTSTAGGRKFQN